MDGRGIDRTYLRPIPDTRSSLNIETIAYTIETNVADVFPRLSIHLSPLGPVRFKSSPTSMIVSGRRLIIEISSKIDKSQESRAKARGCVTLL